MLLIWTLVIAWIGYCIGMYTTDKFYNFGNTEGVSRKIHINNDDNYATPPDFYKEFIDWFKANKKRFAHGQFDEKQIVYSAWLEGRKQANGVTTDLYVVELSDEEIKIIDQKELDEWYKSAEEFDGFIGFTIRGKLMK